MRFEEIRPDKLYFVYDKNNNQKIGEVELLVEDTYYWLNRIYIEVSGKKYGMETIKYLTKNYTFFKVSLSSKSAHYSNGFKYNGVDDCRGLTPEGVHLMKKCFEEGILKNQISVFRFQK